MYYIVHYKKKEEQHDFNLDKWRNLVDNDDDLFWFESTPHGKEVFESMENDEIRYQNSKKVAHYDYNKKHGHGNVQFNLIDHVERYNTFLSILHTRITKKRLIKYYEIAEKLGVKLYKGQRHINKQKLELLCSKLR